MKLNLISGMFCLLLSAMTISALALFMLLFGMLAAAYGVKVPLFN